MFFREVMRNSYECKLRGGRVLWGGNGTFRVKEENRFCDIVVYNSLCV